MGVPLIMGFELPYINYTSLPSAAAWPKQKKGVAARCCNPLISLARPPGIEPGLRLTGG
jgi:hypothetical protein